MRISRLQPPIVRLPPKSSFETMLTTSARVALVLLGVLATVAALQYGRFLLAPFLLSVIIGLMFGPMATRLERHGIPPSVSAVCVVVAFVALLAIAFTLFAVPLSTWIDRLPLIWTKLKTQMTSWKDVFTTLQSLQEELNGLTAGDQGVKVNVEGNGPVMSIATFAPSLLAQVLMFLAGLYFFIATRFRIRAMVLAMCMERRLRWRMAHVFRDVEVLVSRYLVSITLINLGLGAAVALTMTALGVPSPLLWGMLAWALNYIVYIGPFAMVLILLGVGLASFFGPLAIAAPAAAYLGLVFLEAHFVTPMTLGRRLPLNPFVVFLALSFWLWIWGPVGGFVAVPTLLIVEAVIKNVIPVPPNS